MKYCRVLIAALAAGLLPASGCAVPSLEERLVDRDPKVRAAAAAALSKTEGPEAEVHLIHLLADEDEGVRFFASAALFKRTGERFGYLSQGGLRERAEAIRRWVAWHADRHPESQDSFADLGPVFRILEPGPGAAEKSQGKD